MSHKILLVDDEPEIRDLLRGVLEQNGYHIDEAESGQSAWKLFQENSFDLVISDVKMPDGDGLELLTKIKDFNEDLPVIIMTGYSGGMLQSKDLLRSEAVLRKPFDLHALLKQIKECFDDPIETQKPSAS